MTNRFETRLLVEEFVYNEADLMDRWKLDEWLALWEPECTYEAVPTAEFDPETASPDSSLFLIADNRFRLEQRLLRLKKDTAHVEYPHSMTRHLFSNVIIRSDTAKDITAQVNFNVFRTKRNVTSQYMGYSLYRFARRNDGSLGIVSKRAILDLTGLVPQGKLSILL